MLRMMNTFLFALCVLTIAVSAASFKDFATGLGGFDTTTKSVVSRELSSAEYAHELRGSNWAKEIANRQLEDVETNLTPRTPQDGGFSFAAGGLVLAGYLTAVAQPIGQIVDNCHAGMGVANHTGACVAACLTAAGLTTAASVVGGTIATRGVAVVQDIKEILNIYPKSDDSSKIDVSHHTDDILADMIEARSQPCPNHNQYAKNFGGRHCRFPGTDYGFKYSCKRGCANTPLGAGNALNSLLHSAAARMVQKRALNMEQTVYVQSSQHVLFRCSVQLESVPTNTCVYSITGNTCHF